MHNRRQFLSESFSSVTGFGVAAAFSAFGGRFALGEIRNRPFDLIPTKDDTTGIALIRLPEGFSYSTYGWTRDPMSDGLPTPGEHDGMGVVAEDQGIVTLVRNHEISRDGKAWQAPNRKPFDSQAQGGCTTLKFDTRNGKWLDSHVAIAGTSRNCAAV